MANKKNRPCKKCSTLIWDVPIKKSTGLCKKCWSVGRTHSLETKIKIRDLAKARWQDPEYWHRSSLAQKKRFEDPSNHPNWKGGATHQRLRNTKRYKELRLRIFERDDYTCQICKVRGGVVQMDHIKAFAYYPDLRFEESNLRTLCLDCHKDTPSYKRKINDES